MSHFAVAVFTRTNPNETEREIEDLLAPFDENDCREFEPIDEESMNDLRENYKKYGESAEEDDKKYASFEEYCTEYKGYHIVDGEIGYMQNPNAKWDWYQIGGRFTDWLPLKDGAEEDDSVKASCIDMSLNKEQYDNAIRFWEIAVEGSQLKDGEERPFIFYKPEYYTDLYKTKEFYAEHMGTPCPFAFISPDGVWHEEGQMGWFGFHDSTHESLLAHIQEFKAMMDLAIQQDMYVTIVDCHI